MKVLIILLCLFSFSYLQAESHTIKYPLNNRVEVLKDEEVLSVIANQGNKPLDLENINLLVWNIFKASKSNLYTDLYKLMKDKSLVLLQEGYDNRDFRSFVPTFSDFIWKMASSFRDNSGIKTGVITASVQPHEKFTFIRSPDSEPILNTPKMSLASYYKLSDSTSLLVINIHGINFVLNYAFERQIEKNFELIANHKGPVIFAGDFNTWNKYRIQYLHKMSVFYGLSKVSLNSPYANGIDHVYQRGFDILDATVLHNVSSSDHLPIFVKLRLGK